MLTENAADLGGGTVCFRVAIPAVAVATPDHLVCQIDGVLDLAWLREGLAASCAKRIVIAATGLILA